MTQEGTPLSLCTQCHYAQEGGRQAPGHPECPSHLVQVGSPSRLGSLTLLCSPWGWVLGLTSDLQKPLGYSWHAAW